MSAPTPISSPVQTILLVSEPGVDGVFHYVKNLAHYLLEHGWQVHLAYSSQRGCPALFTLVERVRASGGQTLDLHVGNGPRPADAVAVARLWSLARKVQPAVIHAHSSKAGVLARALALLGVRARYCYTPHAYYHMYGPANMMKRVFATVERVLGRIGMTLNVSASEAEYARTVIGIPPERIHLVTSGVNCERFRPVENRDEKNALRAKFALPENVTLLGTVGRYTEQKDPQTLYTALAVSLARRPELHFVHLGRGDLFGETEAILQGAPSGVRDRIHRIESTDRPEDFLRALDGFVLPSRYEGLALSALEATATGLPLILTRCPGNTDLEEYALDAIYWAPVEDPAAVAQQIEVWAGVGPIANNHRVTALSHFSLEEAFQSIIRGYGPSVAMSATT